MIGNVLTDIVVVIIILGVLIFVHELGHFLAAKSFGVRVPVFSFGFGPRLLGVRRGKFSFGALAEDDPTATDYRLSPLPFGGYVRLAGEDPSQVHGDDPGEFLSHPRWQRFIVYVMGPAMNVTLAVALLTGLYMVGVGRPTYENQAVRIGEVAPNSPAAKAGLKPGDVILQFGSLHNPKWGDVEDQVPTLVGKHIPLVVQDGSKIERKIIVPAPIGASRIGSVGWGPYLPAVIGSVEAGQPASRAGLRPGDEVVAFNGEPVLSFTSLAGDIAASGGKQITLGIRRGSKTLDFSLKPVLTDLQGEKKYRIGVGSSGLPSFVGKKLPFGRALAAAINDSAQNVTSTFVGIAKIVTRQISPRQISGPIGIARISGEAYHAGLGPLLWFVWLISLQLGILNLLPFPVLDGGGIAMLAIEAVMRRDLSLQVKERLVQFGVVFLLLLMVFVMYDDVVKIIHP